MSDIPEGYFVNGVELLDFRREPILIFPGEVPKKKSRKQRQPAEPKRRALNMRDGNLCHYCRNVMRGKGPFCPSIEHVVPKSLGGSNELYNLVLACVKCNNRLGSQYIKCECKFCKYARYVHENN